MEMQQNSLKYIQAYYLATPLFVVLDAAVGLEMRAAFIDNAGGRYTWYGFCFLLGLAAWRWPGAAPLVGVLESAVNFALLCISVVTPLFLLPADPSEISGEVGLTGQDLAAFVLIGGACIVSFHLALHQMQVSLRRTRSL